MSKKMIVVPVSASKEYNVYIGSGLLAQAGEKIAEACGFCKGAKAVIVTDDIVNKLYSDTVENSLINAGYSVTRFVFPHGEQSKNTETYIALLRELSRASLTRTDVVAALGGGVTGDLTGFAAATYLRGIRFAQIPTTLLAMVDSSVGGKTAVNLPSGKNQVGAFYQPDIVICDYDTLQTLPEKIFRGGCAEMIKHAVIKSAELFELLKKPIEHNIENIIAHNITIKRDVVALDEKDTGIRQILNFGHTIGHGIEKHSNYSISHGEAVAIGMVIESRGEYRKQITQMLKRYRLPTETLIPKKQLIEAAFSDKKRTGGKITVIELAKIGECYTKTLDMDKLNEYYNFPNSQ